MTNFKLLTTWMDVDELEEKLRLGDLIEFRRIDKKTKSTSYHHWAVFVGTKDGELSVIHFANEKGDLEVTPTGTGLQRDSTGVKNTIRYDTLYKVAGRSLCRINNCSDCETEPLKPSMIVKKAESKLGSDEYDIVKNNCEHFARWCRYGKYESSQIQIAEVLKKAANGYLHNGLEGALKNSGIEGLRHIRNLAKNELIL